MPLSRMIPCFTSLQRSSSYSPLVRLPLVRSILAVRTCTTSLALLFPFLLLLHIRGDDHNPIPFPIPIPVSISSCLLLTILLHRTPLWRPNLYRNPHVPSFATTPAHPDRTSITFISHRRALPVQGSSRGSASNGRA